MTKRLPALALAALAASGAHFCQLQVDPQRHELAEQPRDVVVSGEVMQVASSGFEVLVADIMWVRAVLAFGQGYEEGSLTEPGWAKWFGGNLLAITQLDPRWKTPYLWGGVMLDVAEAPDQAQEIYLRATQAFPDDYRAWFSLGMLRYFSYDDPQGASKYMARAAECTGAPEWFHGAALSYGAEGMSGRAALGFLEQQLATTTDPDLRADIQARIARQQHQVVKAQIEEVQAQVEGQLQRPIDSIEELERLAGRALPADPLGEGWVLDIDGQIRSQVVARERAETDLQRARGMLTSLRVRPL